MLEERAKESFASLDDFKARTTFTKDELRTLAEIGVLNRLAPHRRAALWEVEKEQRDADLFVKRAVQFGEKTAVLSPHPDPLPQGGNVNARSGDD